MSLTYTLRMLRYWKDQYGVHDEVTKVSEGLSLDGLNFLIADNLNKKPAFHYTFIIEVEE